MSFFSRVTICVKCFLKSKRVKRKKSDSIVFRVYNPNFKLLSLSLEKKNKNSRVLKKGGASLSFLLLFSSLITSSIPLREEHERRLSSYNEQRKERAREEETTLFFCSFLQNFYLRSKLLGGGEASHLFP